jgi:hypothetical protein
MLKSRFCILFCLVLFFIIKCTETLFYLTSLTDHISSSLLAYGVRRTTCLLDVTLFIRAEKKKRLPAPSLNIASKNLISTAVIEVKCAVHDSQQIGLAANGVLLATTRNDLSEVWRELSDKIRSLYTLIAVLDKVNCYIIARVFEISHDVFDLLGCCALLLDSGLPTFQNSVLVPFFKDQDI